MLFVADCAHSLMVPFARMIAPCAFTFAICKMQPPFGIALNCNFLPGNCSCYKQYLWPVNLCPCTGRTMQLGRLAQAKAKPIILGLTGVPSWNGKLSSNATAPAVVGTPTTS